MSADAAYFARLARVLDAHGGGVPRLVLDLDRLDRNVAALQPLLRGRALRLVVKSLPALDLLARVAERAGTRRFMCFHAPFLPALLARFPDADVLMGKPMPLAAVADALARLDAAVDRVAWLVDDRSRVDALAALARARGRELRVAVELDVGMHRGGVGDAVELRAVLSAIAAARGVLRFAGFMGYDAHAAKAPWPATPARAAHASARRYAEFVAAARTAQPGLLAEPFVCNGAGSPTVALVAAGSPVDDVALGSALVKPADFDVPGLEALGCAAWIGAPVLKVLPGVRLPFLDWLRGAGSGGRRTVFTYGGRWLARPAWPAGLRTSALYGLSSNQQFHTVPEGVPLAPGDWAFFRPTQSEAVLLQFGPLLAASADGSVTEWPVLDYLPGGARGA